MSSSRSYIGNTTIIADVPPYSANDGDIWYNPTNGRQAIYRYGAWAHTGGVIKPLPETLWSTQGHYIVWDEDYDACIYSAADRLKRYCANAKSVDQIRHMFEAYIRRCTAEQVVPPAPRVIPENYGDF